MLHWEELKSNRFHVLRTAVPNGWLVYVYHPRETVGERIVSEGGVTFYPDPGHEWKDTSDAEVIA